jgi:hypothetical protein
VIIAQGKSEAAKLVSESSKQYGDSKFLTSIFFKKSPSNSTSAMIQLKKMEAALNIANNLSASGNVAFVPQGGNFLFNL